MLLAGNTDLYLSDNGERVGTRVQGADPSKYRLTQVGDDIQQVFRYLELPLMLRYKVIDSRVGLNLSGGLAYGFLVDNTAYTGEGSEMVRVGHTEGINSHNLSSQLGLGMEYNISSKISFNLEPVFKYYVTPISSISGTFFKPYSVGVWSGFFFKF
jgi:opacity protein-like surface antigen